MIMSLLLITGIASLVCLYTAVVYWAPKYDGKNIDEVPQNVLARLVFFIYDLADAIQERYLSRCTMCGLSLASSSDLALHRELVHSP